MPERGKLGEGHRDARSSALPAGRGGGHVEEDPTTSVRHGFRLERLGGLALSPGAHARIVEEVDAAAEVERLGELDELERREKDGLLSRPVVLSLTDRGREFQEHAAVATFRSRTVGFGLERRTDHRELARRLRLVHRKVAVHAGRGRRRRRLSGRTLLLLRLLRLLLVLRMRVRLRGVRLMELAALLSARRRLLLRALRLVLLLLSSSLERGGVRGLAPGGGARDARAAGDPHDGLGATATGTGGPGDDERVRAVSRGSGGGGEISVVGTAGRRARRARGRGESRARRRRRRAPERAGEGHGDAATDVGGGTREGHARAAGGTRTREPRHEEQDTGAFQKAGDERHLPGRRTAAAREHRTSARARDERRRECAQRRERTFATRASVCRGGSRRAGRPDRRRSRRRVDIGAGDEDSVGSASDERSFPILWRNGLANIRN